MVIYRGEIRNMFIKDMEFFEGTTVVKTDSVVVKQDALFYRGIMDRKISFDYDTYLSTEEEARDLIQDSAKRNPTNCIDTCLYVDYSTLVPEEVKRSEFKKIKKAYKACRKEM